MIFSGSVPSLGWSSFALFSLPFLSFRVRKISLADSSLRLGQGNWVSLYHQIINPILISTIHSGDSGAPVGGGWAGRGRGSPAGGHPRGQPSQPALHLQQGVRHRPDAGWVYKVNALEKKTKSHSTYVHLRPFCPCRKIYVWTWKYIKHFSFHFFLLISLIP